MNKLQLLSELAFLICDVDNVDPDKTLSYYSFYSKQHILQDYQVVYQKRIFREHLHQKLLLFESQKEKVLIFFGSMHPIML